MIYTRIRSTYSGSYSSAYSLNNVSSTGTNALASRLFGGNYNVVDLKENAIVNVELPKDATANVSAVVGGKTYVAPIKDGKATITIPELAAGNYNVPVTYSGDDKYNQLTEEIKITVDEDKSDIIKAPDVTKYFNGPERFVVTVTDYQGKPLANKSVTIVINGVPYNRKTNDNGTTSMALNLETGVSGVSTP